MDTLVIRRPDDFHMHLRQDRMLKQILELVAYTYGRGVVMPNLRDPLTTALSVLNYQDDIRALLPEESVFTPLGALFLTDKTTREEILCAKKAGIRIVKYYPKGVTTGSRHGVSNVQALRHVFEVMQYYGIVLSLHGEMPGMHSDYAEYEFFRGPFWWIYQNFPELKIVWEHVTTAYIVKLLARYPVRVGATITAHHLMINRDDVLSNPHNYCKPPAKSEEDQVELIKAAVSGNPKFFFGSDSAPHYKWKKESANVPAGVFSAPVALQVLAQVFDTVGALNKLEDFTSRFGAEFYGLPLNKDNVVLVKEPWQVPGAYTRIVGDVATDAIVPFLAGQTLDWQIAEEETAEEEIANEK